MGREGLIHPNKMVCSNVAVDLNTGIEELPASPSASFFGTLRGRGGFRPVTGASYIDDASFSPSALPAST